MRSPQRPTPPVGPTGEWPVAQRVGPIRGGSPRTTGPPGQRPTPPARTARVLLPVGAGGPEPTDKRCDGRREPNTLHAPAKTPPDTAALCATGIAREPAIQSHTAPPPTESRTRHQIRRRCPPTRRRRDPEQRHSSAFPIRETTPPPFARPCLLDPLNHHISGSRVSPPIPAVPWSKAHRANAGEPRRAVDSRLVRSRIPTLRRRGS